MNETKMTQVDRNVPKKRNLILIGYMGAGKTSVGEVCAALSSRPLIDTDARIEQEAGMSVSDIFDRYGEEEFRARETALLKVLLAGTDGCVISAGGGLPLREENRQLLKQLGTVVFLRVKPETVCKRLSGDTTRPLLPGDDMAEKVKAMLAVRNPFYGEAAHWIVDTDYGTPGDIAAVVTKTAGWP